MLPAITIDFSPVPSTTNPLGAKGVGEGGTVASTRMVMNAILDAVAPLGVGDVPMPATPSASGVPCASTGVAEAARYSGPVLGSPALLLRLDCFSRCDCHDVKPITFEMWLPRRFAE
jgi:hypothetical protein